ncbi:hypothetical protein J14TS5_08090 [Paenibacillus lautus]|nr:hypothetical protein J14TS5_08090 [Paenibacillus lautus]
MTDCREKEGNHKRVLFTLNSWEGTNPLNEWIPHALLACQDRFASETRLTQSHTYEVMLIG